MELYKFRNVSGKNYLLPELGELDGRGHLKGRKVGCNENEVFGCNEEEIYRCPLLSRLIENGSLVQCSGEDNDPFSDKVLDNYQIQDDDVILSLDKLSGTPVPNPNPATYAPRDVLIDDQPARNILVDEYQKENIKSIYEEVDVKKK